MDNSILIIGLIAILVLVLGTFAAIKIKKQKEIQEIRRDEYSRPA